MWRLTCFRLPSYVDTHSNMLPWLTAGGSRWCHIYLHADHAVAQVEDAGHPAGQSPQAVPPVPGGAGGLDHRVKCLLVRVDPEIDHRDGARSDGRALHHKFHGGVANLALGVGPVSDAHQGFAVPARQFDGSAIGRRQCLHDAVGGAFGLHGTGWASRSLRGRGR